MNDIESITGEADKIAESGILGRSRTYGRLLAYLVRCSADGGRPKEIEIAVDVFDKGSDFNPNQDSLVRVYVHNLRQKLDKYYAKHPDTDGMRLAIPKGEYRLAFVPVSPAVQVGGVSNMPPLWLSVVAALLVLNLAAVLIFEWGSGQAGNYEEVAGSPVWSDILGEEFPLLVVVGDYYIFGELDEAGNVSRLVREFDVNSSDDLDELFVYEPDLQASYLDLDLTYLPQGTAFALKDLLRVVYTSNKSVRVTSMSELRVADLKSHDILYVGYISALGTLMDFVFSSSGLRVGESYDELLNWRTGEYFTSGAGLPEEGNYQDYGLISTFPGPDGNQFLIVAGTRDSGVMHTAQALSAPADMAMLEQALALGSEPGPPAFEALYEVTGFDRMNLDAMVVYLSSLDYGQIWGGELTAR